MTYNRGDKVLGPAYSRGLPIYEYVQQLHGEDDLHVLKSLDRFIVCSGRDITSAPKDGTFYALGSTIRYYNKTTDHSFCGNFKTGEIADKVSRFLNENNFLLVETEE